MKLKVPQGIQRPSMAFSRGSLLSRAKCHCTDHLMYYRFVLGGHSTGHGDTKGTHSHISNPPRGEFLLPWLEKKF